MKGRLRQVLAAAALLLAAAPSWGCSLCLSAFELELNAQFLVHAQHAVLAVPEASQRYKVVAVIKRGPAVGELVDGKVTRLGSPFAQGDSAPRLLMREEGWLMWVDLGAVDPDQAGWLRTVASFSPNADLTEKQRAQQVAFFLPALASPEPMVRKMAAAEIASAPYSAMRANRTKIDLSLVRDRLSAPAYAQQRSLYWLLLGFAGNAEDAARLDEELDRVWKAHDTTDLAAKLAALVELRGQAGIEKLERLYLRDGRRTPEERRAAAQALEETGRLTSRPGSSGNAATASGAAQGEARRR